MSGKVLRLPTYSNGCPGVLNIGGLHYQCVEPFGHGSGCANPTAGAAWASAVAVDRLAAEDAEIVDAEVVE